MLVGVHRHTLQLQCLKSSPDSGYLCVPILSMVLILAHGILDKAGQDVHSAVVVLRV